MRSSETEAAHLDWPWVYDEDYVADEEQQGLVLLKAASTYGVSLDGWVFVGRNGSYKQWPHELWCLLMIWNQQNTSAELS